MSREQVAWMCVGIIVSALVGLASLTLGKVIDGQIRQFHWLQEHERRLDKLEDTDDDERRRASGAAN